MVVALELIHNQGRLGGNESKGARNMIDGHVLCTGYFDDLTTYGAIRETVHLHSLGPLRNIRGKCSSGNWAVEYTRADKTHMVYSKYFDLKKEALAWIKRITNDIAKYPPAYWCEDCGRKGCGAPGTENQIHAGYVDTGRPVSLCMTCFATRCSGA